MSPFDLPGRPLKILDGTKITCPHCGTINWKKGKPIKKLQKENIIAIKCRKQNCGKPIILSKPQ